MLFVSGHMTDRPGRFRPRFPESQVDVVAAKIAEVLDQWGVDASWRVLVSAARGADLLAAQQARLRGASVEVWLPLPREEFLRESVDGGDPARTAFWHEAFDSVVGQADRVHDADLSAEPHGPFAAANQVMLAELRGVAVADRRGLLVWDGAATTEPGGTGTIAAEAARVVYDADSVGHYPGLRDPVRVVDPVPRGYDGRVADGGTKTVLTLDGGGIRGLVTLEVLAQMEAQLRDLRGDENLVLADYFDYVSGTSTGAIIATALSLGLSVHDIRRGYLSLGEKVFRWHLPSLVHLTRHSGARLKDSLEDFLDACGVDDPAGLTLGDPQLKTLLLLVLHEAATDSPWLLSNAPRARFNLPEMALPCFGAQRNLDVPLLDLVCASAAAPTYFPPRELTIGSRHVFQDGSMSSFNNPALVSYAVTTTPAYGLSWTAGADKLLIVSVGTGVAPASRREPRAVVEGSRARRLASGIADWKNWPIVLAAQDFPSFVPALMNGGTFANDLLCRVVGDCRHGPKLDGEVDRLMRDADAPSRCAEPLFSYLRYNADLPKEGKLRRLGLVGPVTSVVARMSAADQTRGLREVGRLAAAEVNVPTHFRGFLDASS